MGFRGTCTSEGSRDLPCRAVLLLTMLPDPNYILSEEIFHFILVSLSVYLSNDEDPGVTLELYVVAEPEVIGQLLPGYKVPQRL